MSSPIGKFSPKALFPCILHNTSPISPMTPPLRRLSYNTLLECLIVIDHLKDEPESVDAEHVEELLEDIEKLLDVLDPDTHPSHSFTHGAN